MKHSTSASTNGAFFTPGMSYCIVSTPYSGKRRSPVATMQLFSEAVAMMDRSAGSLWISGRAEARSASRVFPFRRVVAEPIAVHLHLARKSGQGGKSRMTTNLFSTSARNPEKFAFASLTFNIVGMVSPLTPQLYHNPPLPQSGSCVSRETRGLTLHQTKCTL